MTPPKKMLRLNALGKFSSPPGKKTGDEEQGEEPKRRRGRPRKSKEIVQEKHLVVVIRYATASSVGPRISRVLSGEERVEKELPKPATPKKPRTPRKPQPTKSTHPFFLGKPKEGEILPKHVSPRKTSAVTPGKLRSETMANRSPLKQDLRPAQEYAIGSGLLKDRLMFKHPGAKEPAWPNREQAHVRGIENLDPLTPPSSEDSYNRRKRKTAKLPFPTNESILTLFSSRLTPEVQGKLREDGFRDPHPSLTLPAKLLIAGEQIAQRIAAELSVNFNGDQTVQSSPRQSNIIHPALHVLYSKLPIVLSAFDENRGEGLGWVQKYGPTSTTAVLQPPREMNILRQWLTSLTVTSVRSNNDMDKKTAAKLERKPKKKRKRRNDDLDDFLVSDDEEVRDMDELSDDESTPPSSAANRKGAKSVVQGVADGMRLSNALLLSGPHGCGKTAAAHAVAKELGFKIFEISPCERRSGKDVLDKVGDMTENHLVKHHGTDVGELCSAEEPSKHEEAFQRDLATGRQGTMSSFFKPASKPKEISPKEKQIVPKKVTIEAVKEAIKRPAKDQQQSLILLEEVDVLFKDDKDFWTTIFKLIESSKRPFIMTCNDEDLVPFQAMSLHAILRLSPPAPDLVADYLLLMAACEGHLLKRDAVLSLYQSKDFDLRASIAELDFWCQIGVGDPRGGLSWIFQRYPPGSDLDAQGRKLRVVSEGTYAPAMSSSLDDGLDDATRLCWAACEFDLAPADLLGWTGGDAGASMDSLKRFSFVADAFSANDVYAGRFTASLLDTTQPEMPEKSRGHYIEGMKLLQTDEAADHTQLSAQLSATSTLTALRCANILNPTHALLRNNLAQTLHSTKQHTQHQQHQSLTRHSFSTFDPIALPSDPPAQSTLSQSSFDGPLTPIAIDLAPYVRSIVHYDLAFSSQRERLHGILSEGGGGKRARTTRAARSAVEGSQRGATRRERWFCKDLDYGAVLTTAGEGWPKCCAAVVGLGEGESRGPSRDETPEGMEE
ncbi:hypothetical protein BDY17DRAFT_245895 [Neohortaea acidophila]|uniref:AAA+ ATPase domain-containing protein n=1 Tax=Neohortaea acidophila TaxID=245834 RepID=A0A6A6Q2S5_9PEZI|nr:uncharacterized protein BDY17DRAFT_245895 [Neohortaea acidophila]KAF2486294.1 hypothetical protein BDY17DRAFT_245895 [Neohortaea acidophila]